MKCYICKQEVGSEEELIEHIKTVHDDLLAPTDSNPDGYTAEQLWYHEKNKYKLKSIGVCACGRLKPWDKDKNKYKYYCGSQECKDKMRQVAVNNSMNKFGVENPAELEENQLAMMEGKGKTLYALNEHDYLIVDKNNCDKEETLRDINTKYKEASKYVYLSKVEEKTLISLLSFFKHSNIIAPMKNSDISYKLPNDDKLHNHIPDIFVSSLRLIISCKDSILNPNMHPNMKKDRFKNLYEYQFILNHTDYNYIQIEGEEDVDNLPKYISAIKSTVYGGGRYVSPPKVDIYVLMQETFFDDSEFKLDTFIINEQGFILRNRNSDYGYRVKEGNLEIVEVEKFNNVVYETSTITDILYGESIDILFNDTDRITDIIERFRFMEFDEMVDILEDYEILVTDAQVM